MKLEVYNHIGQCALCGKKCKLSFEHIPPKSAFNKSNAHAIAGKNLINMLSNPDKLPWDTSHVPYQQQQSGSGIYSLCEECKIYEILF